LQKTSQEDVIEEEEEVPETQRGWRVWGASPRGEDLRKSTMETATEMLNGWFSLDFYPKKKPLWGLVYHGASIRCNAKKFVA
jgi:hypothetical protein